MRRARLLVWIVALVALLMPPGMTAHAMASAAQSTSVDCADHAPTPPCPDLGTAKHAGGTCCPLMTCSVAVVPPAGPVETMLRVEPRPHTRVVQLNGLTYTKDPPPPRV